MGQQNPYETVDNFARGLVDQFAIASGQRPMIEPLMIEHAGWNEVAVRLNLGNKTTASGSSVLDLYEFYWAPYTEGKINYRQTLDWLRRTALTPIRYLATAYALFDRPGRRDQLSGAFLKEILRVLFLLLPVAALTYLAGYLVNKGDRLAPLASALAGIWRTSDGSRQTGLVGWVALVILVIVLLGGLRRLRVETASFALRGVRGLEEGAIRRWRGYMLLALILSLLLVASLTVWLWSDLLLYWERSAKLHLVPAILAIWVLRRFRRILVNYVGDIAVYANADEKARSFEARSKILGEAREAVLRLIRSPERYERIVLAGHSLGSVISYDLLNRLLDEVRAPYGTGPEGPTTGKLTAQELERVQALITFGSPLDKIYYFFRTEVPADQAIRAQILSFLHGFRRAASGRVYGPYRFTKYDIPDPSPGFKWINIWSNADPLSGHLDFYDVAGRGASNPSAGQYERPYPWYRWGIAHLMYWRDPGFYKIIIEEIFWSAPAKRSDDGALT